MDAPRKVELTLPDGDHLGICKFGRNEPDQERFEIIIAHLERLIGEAKALEHIGDEAAKALESLCPLGFHGYFMAKRATMGTCEWIAKRKEFQDWIGDDKDTQMLWIQGPPASGKSYLARHIVTSLIPPSMQKVAHCFLDDSVPGRGSLEDLLRATLHHALRVEPELIQQYLVPPHREATQDPRNRKSDDDIWKKELLMSMWPEVVARVTSRGPLTLVVDGFDEMSLDCRQGFLDCLNAFRARAESDPQVHGERLRVLMLSREDPEADQQLNGREDFQVYRITPGDTLDDMKKTIKATLTGSRNRDGQDFASDRTQTSAPLDESQLEEIAEVIASASQTNYLLARMTAEEVSEPLAVDNPIPITGLLEELPSDVEGIYDRILKRMRQDDEYLPFVRHVLRWAAFQVEPLREPELDTAIALGMAQDQEPEHAISSQELEVFQELLGSVRPMLEKHCRRAAEVQEGLLQPVHDILKERLASRSIDGLHVEEGPSHATLASICITYLTMSYFEDPNSPPADTLEDKVKKRIEAHAFSRYAALHWLDHVKASGGAWSGVDDHVSRAQQLLENNTTPYAISCSEIRWYLTRGTMQGFDSGSLGGHAFARRTPSSSRSDRRSSSAVGSQSRSSETSRDEADEIREMEAGSLLDGVEKPSTEVSQLIQPDASKQPTTLPGLQHGQESDFEPPSRSRPGSMLWGSGDNRDDAHILDRSERVVTTREKAELARRPQLNTLGSEEPVDIGNQQSAHALDDLDGAVSHEPQKHIQKAEFEHQAATPSLDAELESKAGELHPDTELGLGRHEEHLELDNDDQPRPYLGAEEPAISSRTSQHIDMSKESQHAETEAPGDLEIQLDDARLQDSALDIAQLGQQDKPESSHGTVPQDFTPRDTESEEPQPDLEQSGLHPEPPWGQAHPKDVEHIKMPEDPGPEPTLDAQETTHPAPLPPQPESQGPAENTVAEKATPKITLGSTRTRAALQYLFPDRVIGARPVHVGPERQYQQTPDTNTGRKLDGHQAVPIVTQALPETKVERNDGNMMEGAQTPHAGPEQSVRVDSPRPETSHTATRHDDGGGGGDDDEARTRAMPESHDGETGAKDTRISGGSGAPSPRQEIGPDQEEEREEEEAEEEEAAEGGQGGVVTEAERKKKRGILSKFFKGAKKLGMSACVFELRRCSTS